MSANVILDLRNTKATFKNVQRLVSAEGMEQIGQAVKKLNLEQIKAQIEATGKRVKPYSTLYALRKGETTVSYVGKKSTYSKKKRGGGHMMFDFSVVGKYGSAKIGFRSKTAKQKAKWNTEHRTFIGLTAGNYKRLLKWVYRKFNL